MHVGKNYSGEYYDELQKSYETLSDKRSDYIKAVDKYIIENINLMDINNLNWIDIGCGDGRRTKYLYCNLKNIENLDCVEESKVMAREANKNLNGIHQKIFNSAVETAPLAPLRYHVATCLWNVIGHTSKRHEFINSIYSCLKVGGVLFIDANNRFNISEYGLLPVLRNIILSKLGIKNGYFKLSVNKVSTNVYIFEKKELKRLLLNVGFKRVDIRYLNYKTGKRGNWLNGQMVFKAYK